MDDDEKRRQVEILVKQLELPITNFSIAAGNQMQIYFETDSIGWIGFIAVPTNGPTVYKYYTNDDVVAKLNWLPIFNKFRPQITQAVRNTVKDQSIEVSPGNPKHVFIITDPEERKLPQLKYRVAFRNNEWIAFE